MNTNQIAKAITKANNAYINHERYSQLIKEAKIIKISFRDLVNTSAVASQYVEVVKSSPIGLPFGNIIFNIDGYPMSSMSTGEIETKPFSLHIMPCIITFNQHNLVTMVATDIRINKQKEVLTRSYILYADLAGVHVMTAVDRASEKNGCSCFKQNVFNTDAGLALQFLERLPGFVADSGFALPDCAGLQAGCAPINACKLEMSALIKLILAYCNLPSNFFVKVVDRINKSPSIYHIIADSAQWTKICAGDEEAETIGNGFNDGSNLLKAIAAEPAQIPASLTVANKTYTPLEKGQDDEVRTIAEDGQEGDGSNKSTVGTDLSENAS